MSGSDEKRIEFKDRVRAWSRSLDLDPIQFSIAVRPMVSKWASCSPGGKLTFNSDLLDLIPDLQDYVIVHELLHLFVPNHGRLWKALMTAHLSDWRQLDNDLRMAAARGARVSIDNVPN